MSVAFRRETDEEHREPTFERPIPAGPNLVTPRGLRLIEARIAELAAAIAQAHDPAGVNALERDLRYWQTRQITAEVVPVASGAKVAFGTEVRIVLNGTLRTVRLVGDDEAAPAAGLVSFKAPLSRAILNAQAGDVLPFGTAEEAIEILSVEVWKP